MVSRLASRVGALAGAVTLALFPVLPAAIAVPQLTVEYNDAVYGDVALTGNTVTTCPSQPGQYPVRLCHDAQNRLGTGPSAMNNGHPMRWSDVDGKAGTYDSSSGRLAIPSGARVVHAALTWAGATGGRADTPCGRSTARPPGRPAPRGSKPCR